MTSVGTHSSPSQPGRRPRRRALLLLALGITATLVAWGVLVWAAIDFGREARAGEPDAWVFLGLATVGAAACLFLTLILGARAVSIAQGKERPKPPPRVPGGRRAAR